MVLFGQLIALESPLTHDPSTADIDFDRVLRRRLAGTGLRETVIVSIETFPVDHHRSIYRVSVAVCALRMVHNLVIGYSVSAPPGDQIIHRHGYIVKDTRKDRIRPEDSQLLGVIPISLYELTSKLESVILSRNYVQITSRHRNEGDVGLPLYSFLPYMPRITLSMHYITPAIVRFRAVMPQQADPGNRILIENCYFIFDSLMSLLGRDIVPPADENVNVAECVLLAFFASAAFYHRQSPNYNAAGPIARLRRNLTRVMRRVANGRFIKYPEILPEADLSETMCPPTSQYEEILPRTVIPEETTPEEAQSDDLYSSGESLL